MRFFRKTSRMMKRRSRWAARLTRRLRPRSIAWKALKSGTWKEKCTKVLPLLQARARDKLAQRAGALRRKSCFLGNFLSNHLELGQLMRAKRGDHGNISR